jgi:hypothetical protein
MKLNNLLKILVICILTSYIICEDLKYIQVQDVSGNKLEIENINLVLWNKGTRSGKSILKFIKHFSSLEQYKEVEENYKKVSKDFTCNLTESSIVCIIFANQILNINYRKVDEDLGYISYSTTLKQETAEHPIVLQFQIIDKIENLDKNLKSILGLE